MCVCVCVRAHMCACMLARLCVSMLVSACVCSVRSSRVLVRTLVRSCVCSARSSTCVCVCLCVCVFVCVLRGSDRWRELTDQTRADGLHVSVEVTVGVLDPHHSQTATGESAPRPSLFFYTLRIWHLLATNSCQASDRRG